MKNKVIALMSAMIVLAFLLPSATAWNRDDHNKYMHQVLFGKDYNKNDYTEQELSRLQALESASYLAIDQFSGNGSDDLEKLSDFGVSQLPSSIDEFDFPGNQHHRRYTHRGWSGPYNNADRPYQDDRAHWNTRKAILIQTAKKVFALDDSQSALADSMGALIYYVHVLGDHIDETDYKKMNSDLIGVGGRNDQNDIIHQLIDHFDVLFTAPTSRHRYNSFRSELLLLNKNFSELVNSDGGDDTSAKQGEYVKLAKYLMDLLIKYVPELLREEAYFTGAFPSRK